MIIDHADFPIEKLSLEHSISLIQKLPLNATILRTPQDMEVPEEHNFHHFSHQHPLKKTIAPPKGNISCNGCSLRILPGKNHYHCRTCSSFCLHQVCSNMPRKARHPAHPDRYLALLASWPPSADSKFKCEACGDYIDGFHYKVDESGVYYHMLCLVLPREFVISSHPHTLEIEFSPPYDFSCDLCLKPSSEGWLYRCGFCEFDAHVGCALSYQSWAESVPPPYTTTRQNIYSSESTMEANQEVDYGSESNELMELIAQKVAMDTIKRNDNREVARSVAVAAGWDVRLHSPLSRSKPNVPSTFSSPVSRDRNQHTASVSEDFTISSYQFSDLCFSIDLLKSYSSTDRHLYPTDNQASFRYKKGAAAEVEAKIKVNDSAAAEPDCVQDLDFPKKPVSNPDYRDPDNWLHEAFVAGGINHSGKNLIQPGEKRKPNGYASREGIKDQINKSNVEMSSSSSCFQKLFPCFYPPRYEKFSKSFKKRGHI